MTRSIAPSTSSAGQSCGPPRSAAIASMCQSWQAQVVDHLDVQWEDHGDPATMLPEPLVGQQRQRQAEQNETGIGEAASQHLPSTVNGLPVKTLILRNLPARVTQQELLPCLPGPGAAKYNLFHVPQKGQTLSGWAFLNFESHGDASEFFRQWHGRQVEILMGGAVSCSEIHIEAAMHQGLVVNLMRWQTKMRGLSNPDVLPFVFANGQRKDFWQYARGMRAFIRGRQYQRDGISYTVQL